MAADQVQITKTYREDHWVVRVEMLPAEGGVLPLDVFTHENTGTTTLGKYVGVCSVDELQRFQAWAGAQIRKFGNRYVRYRIAEIHLQPGTDPARTISIIRENLASLRTAISLGTQSTTIYPIT